MALCSGWHRNKIWTLPLTLTEMRFPSGFAKSGNICVTRQTV
jgi:hypothetical protein